MTPPYVPSRRGVGSFPGAASVRSDATPPNLPPLPGQAIHHPVEPLDLALLADLPSLELRARFIMDAFLSGLHRSPRKGSSVEFAEYRNYQYGDDLRRVDWRLYGRTDRLRVKQTEHETQMRVFLVLDTSGSMNYTSRPGELLSKIDFARAMLAACALLAMRQGDAFGLALIGAGLTDYLKPKAAPSQWRSLLGKLDQARTGGTTGLANGLEELGEILPPRSLVIIASDFYDEGERFQQVLRRYRFERQEVVALQVLDPIEIDFDQDWSGTFHDAETSSRLILDASAVRAGYLERFRAFLGRVSERVRSERGDHAVLRTDASPARALGYYLAHRERRL